MRVTSFRVTGRSTLLTATSDNRIILSNRNRITAFGGPIPASRGAQEGDREPESDGFAQAFVAEHSRKKVGAKGGGRVKQDTPEGLLSDAELREVREQYADGITAVQIVELFASRGVRFSEATFRKYVQQGLLPRSRRIGRKGKHRGSLGVYPAKVVHRINLIKSLMSDGYTIDQIQSQFLKFTDVIEKLEEGLQSIFELFNEDAESPRFDSKARKSISREIADAEKSADELMTRINELSERLSQSHEDSYRSTGAAGSAEDLL